MIANGVCPGMGDREASSRALQANARVLDDEGYRFVTIIYFSLNNEQYNSDINERTMADRVAMVVVGGRQTRRVHSFVSVRSLKACFLRLPWCHRE